MESLYYGQIARRELAARQSAILGSVTAELLEAADRGALAELGHHQEELAARRCERVVREDVLRQVHWQDLRAGDRVDVSAENPFEAERDRLAGLISAQDLDSVIARYPIQKTGVCDGVAKALQFQGHQQYEAAVVNAVRQDPSFRTALRAELQALDDALGPFAPV